MSGRATPVLLSDILNYTGDPLERGMLEEVWAKNRGAIQAMRTRSKPGGRVNLKIPVLEALGNNAARQFVHPDFHYRGSQTHGLVFLENPAISIKALETYASFDTLTAGSTWARDVLRERGVQYTEMCLQGVDTALFHPAPRRGYLKDRFVIFSGGKLEIRKGQDIVIEAVRRFRERHPETLLVCLWDNPILGGFFVNLLNQSPYHPGMMKCVGDAGINWERMFDEAGLPADAVRALPLTVNWNLPQIMREADVALFPNRCEGGTNLIAMQAMACGVPCVLSANSGHLDIIEDGACLPLRRQNPVVIKHPELSTQGWGESDIEEILEALEIVYRDRKKARAIGAAGADLMAGYSWKTQIDHLASLIGL
jgi:glycosyltransferase involved in cell wall biosynthesis